MPNKVHNAKILSKLTYASPAWRGFANQEDTKRIDSFLRRSGKYGYYPENGYTFEKLFCRADGKLFNKINGNLKHVLFKLLPDIKHTNYNLRKRGHNFILPLKDNRNFISRIMYRSLAVNNAGE